ncbi:hypothetical protein GCM10010347_65590 [Streptomyces cirratus]|uniref:Uncharacterized protein n=1 Tax=Streptomyces cirratus TaxID=68187 RepID=A0ABQ3F5L2_9ACTN|nr:hypothetical protein GCM10010347_65590 [Streptomyces cirratus]
MGSARVAVNFTSKVLHGKTSKPGSVEDFVGFGSFAGFDVVDGLADAVGLAGVGGTAGVADFAGLAVDPPAPPPAVSSEGPQAVRAASADTAARTAAALGTVLMCGSPR